MWLCDLERAVADLRQYCPIYVYEKILPHPNGIVFYTTHFSRIFWSNDGKIFERYENGDIKEWK
jgi:hypothetical protein